MTRIPHTDSPTQVRQAFQRLTDLTGVITTGQVGAVLIGAGVGVAPAWSTSLTTLTLLTVDNITINGAVISSDTGAISFVNENLSTTGTISSGMLVVDNLILDGALIESDTGAISFGDEDLSTAGSMTAINVTSGEDPGHTHTGASVGGLDISSDTNLAVTAPIVLTDDTLSLNMGAVDHNSLLNTHNLTTDIDHASITNTHNLTTDINHASITNTHNLTTDIDHATITNAHNLTTDVDHDTITNTHNLNTDLDINGLTGESGIAAADTIPFYDSGVGNRKITLTELYTALGVTPGKVKVDTGATANFLGAAAGDGVLRVNGALSYVDGGNFVTLGGSTTRYRGHLSANQDIPTGTYTKVVFDVEDFDGGGDGAGGTFTAPASGYYVVSIASGLAENIAAGDWFIVNIYVNGASYSGQGIKNTGAGANSLNASIADVVYVPSGQTVELYVWHDFGSNREIASGAVTFMSIHRLS